MEQEQPVSIDAIANHIGCSEKTARNEWGALDKFLVENQLGVILRKRSRGVEIARKLSNSEENFTTR